MLTLFNAFFIFFYQDAFYTISHELFEIDTRYKYYTYIDFLVLIQRTKKNVRGVPGRRGAQLLFSLLLKKGPLHITAKFVI